MSTRLRTALVSLLAVALLAFFLRGVNLSDVWMRLRSADWRFLALALAAAPLTYVTRAIRWQYLLAPLGPTRFSLALRATVIGFAALAVLPARVGDILRPYMLAREQGISVSATVATVVMERVLDLIAVLALLALFVWGFADGSTIPPRLLTPIEVSAGVAAGAAVALVGVMWVMASHPERIAAAVLALTRVLPVRLGAKLSGLARTFSGGFAVTRDVRGFLLALSWSIPIWVVISLEAWAVTRAFGIAMPVTGAYLLQGFLVLGVAVPTPGGVGSFHEAYRLGVTMFFQAPNDRAVAAAIVLHVVSFVPVVIAGAVLMAREGWNAERLKTLAQAGASEGALL